MSALDESSIYDSIPVHAKHIAKATKRRLAEMRRETEPVGLSTGFTTLDETGIRLADSELFIIAARPGMGKTSLALQMALNAAQELTPKGKTVMIYSCEMTKGAVLLRMASSLAKVNMQAVKMKKATQDDNNKLDDALDTVSGYDIVINDSTSPDTSKIAAEVSDMSDAGTPVGLLVVDYLELLGDSIYASSETEKIGHIIKRMKAIAKKFLIPVILVSQVARDVDNSANKIPQVSQMSGSRWVEATADKLIVMMRPEYYLEQGATAACELSSDSSGVTYVGVLKNRDGEDKFTVRMGWDGKTTSVYDMHRSIKRTVRDLSAKKPQIVP
jgi:replicative DNA helicase